MATQEISDGSYTAVRNKDTNEVTIRGTLRLNGTAEYAPIMALLKRRSPPAWSRSICAACSS